MSSKKLINPEYQEELEDLLERIDKCGEIAARLISKGLSTEEVKRTVIRQLGYKITNGTVQKIFAAVLTVW